eukprot:scaffold135359_cov15-Prasinocladus_malaysianus.AAC.1
MLHRSPGGMGAEEAMAGEENPGQFHPHLISEVQLFPPAAPSPPCQTHRSCLRYKQSQICSEKVVRGHTIQS